MGAELAERESEYQYELCLAYLFDDFGAENKTQYVPDKEANIIETKILPYFGKKKTG